MALSLRARFLAISVAITLIGLTLFTHVIYDKAIGYKHLLEKNSFQTLVDQLLHQHITDLNLKHIKKQLKAAIHDDKQPASLFAIVDEENNLEDVIYLRASTENLLFKTLSNELNHNKSLKDGVLDLNGKSYYWIKRDLDWFTDKGLFLVITYPLTPSVVNETLTFFGTPLLLSGILLLWIMVWASIILSSLVTKLQNQKQTLKEQADGIKQAHDEALEANNAKSIFLANMSHEIRTPLTSIIGFAESCLDADQSMQERLEATKTIIHSGNHLLHIINEILDLSKIEAGKLDIDTKPVKLIELLHEINMSIKILAQEKNLIFDINYAFPLPKTIVTDPLRLKQILLNLCSNAIKFTEKGHVFLNISYDSITKFLQLKVIDTGIGIHTSQLNNIFSPFKQADSSITRKYGGTGLGLTLSKQLTDKLGGTLTVESEENFGSKFCVQLKMDNTEDIEYDYKADYENMPSLKSNYQKTLPVVSGNILIAEDNQDIRALVKMLLSKIGANLCIVENGKLAVEKTYEEEFDLIFLDIQMPIMDGFETLQILRSNGYTKPIYAMTANTMKEDQDKCESAGFDGFISKPINKAYLYEVIVENLTKSELTKSDVNFITSTLLHTEPQIIKLVDAFLDRIPEILCEINTAYNMKNWDELKNQIHQMKGIGGAFGYAILTRISEKIEFLLTSEDYDQIIPHIEKLNTVCEQAIAGKKENYKIIEM